MTNQATIPLRIGGTEYAEVSLEASSGFAEDDLKRVLQQNIDLVGVKNDLQSTRSA